MIILIYQYYNDWDWNAKTFRHQYFTDAVRWGGITVKQPAQNPLYAEIRSPHGFYEP